MSETLQVRPRTTEVAPRRDSTQAGESPPTTGASGTPRKQIVIVGGGFAGIAAARALKHSDADVILIDRRNHHIFQPLLYQVATAVLAPSDIAAPIRQLEDEQQNVTVILAEVTGIDLASRTVEASCPGVGLRRISFDYLVVAPGMRRAISVTTSSQDTRRVSRAWATPRPSGRRS
jgi:NADH dehydrogenase